MQTTCDFLDAVKSRHALPSDYALAQKLAISKQSISKYRSGADYLGDSTAIKVAILLELDPSVVLAAVHCERAKKPDEKAAWAAMLEKLGGIAAALFIGIGGLSAPSPAQASSASAPPSQLALCQHRRRYAKRRNPVTSIGLLPLERFFLLKHT